MKSAVATSFDKGNNEVMCWGRGKPQREQTAGLREAVRASESRRAGGAPGAGRGSPADGAVGRAEGPQAEGTADVCAVVGGFLELRRGADGRRGWAARLGGLWGCPSRACVKSLASWGAVGAQRGAAGGGTWPLG